MGKLFTGSSLTGRHLDIFVFPLSPGRVPFFKRSGNKRRTRHGIKEDRIYLFAYYLQFINKVAGYNKEYDRKKANKNKIYLFI